MFGKFKESFKKAKGSARSALVEETCPYCFERFRMKTTPFRCASPPTRCAPVPDPVLGKAWGDNRPVAKVLESDGGFTLSRICPDCGQRSHKRLCPHCHQELPHTFGEYRNLIFAVIGAKGAGKSHYLPALIEQFKNHVGPRMNMLLQPMNDFTITRYRNDFYEPLFTRHRTLNVTTSGLVDSKIQFPMLFTLTFTGKGIFGADTIKKAITVVFFDTAGEDLKAEDTMAVVNKYIFRSDGILLLLDPLQLDRVRTRVDSSTLLPPKDTETSDIISRVTKLIRLGQGLGPDAKITTPLAVALSKLDALSPLLNPQMQIATTPRTAPTFDRGDFEATDGEVQSLVAQWDSENVLNQVKTQFTTYGFFGLSALGEAPDADGKVSRVVSRRVEQPFLWLLHKHGLLNAGE